MLQPNKGILVTERESMEKLSDKCVFISMKCIISSITSNLVEQVILIKLDRLYIIFTAYLYSTYKLFTGEIIDIRKFNWVIHLLDDYLTTLLDTSATENRA